jgi:type I restriction enzyme S subunit
VAYVWGTPENILLPDKLWRFVWSKSQSVAPLFIWSLFQIPSFRYELSKRATGTSGSMKNISQEKLLAMKVPLPELKLQEQFASVVKSVQRVQKLYAESNLRMDNLFYTLQQCAFTGKLVTNKAAAAAQQELFAD